MTNEARNWLTATNYGVELRGPTTGFQRVFESKDHNERMPRLRITYHQCFTLTLVHSGSGSDPVPEPDHSAECPAGQYTPGQAIHLTAAPAAGWQVTGWSGTVDDGATSLVNSLTMPAATSGFTRKTAR